jgi:hypothetical protein
MNQTLPAGPQQTFGPTAVPARRALTVRQPRARFPTAAAWPGMAWMKAEKDLLMNVIVWEKAG